MLSRDCRNKISRNYKFICYWSGRLFELAMERPPATEDDYKCIASIAVKAMCGVVELLPSVEVATLPSDDRIFEQDADFVDGVFESCQLTAEQAQGIRKSIMKIISRAKIDIHLSAEFLTEGQIRSFYDK